MVQYPCLFTRWYELKGKCLCQHTDMEWVRAWLLRYIDAGLCFFVCTLNVEYRFVGLGYITWYWKTIVTSYCENDGSLGWFVSPCHARCSRLVEHRSAFWKHRWRRGRRRDGKRWYHRRLWQGNETSFILLCLPIIVLFGILFHGMLLFLWPIWFLAPFDRYLGMIVEIHLNLRIYWRYKSSELISRWLGGDRRRCDTEME